MLNQAFCSEYSSGLYLNPRAISQNCPQAYSSTTNGFQKMIFKIHCIKFQHDYAPIPIQPHNVSPTTIQKTLAALVLCRFVFIHEAVWLHDPQAMHSIKHRELKKLMNRNRVNEFSFLMKIKSC